MSLYENFKPLPVTRRPISAHTATYHRDGTGRDSYISHFNGGLYSQNYIVNHIPKQKPDYPLFRVKNHIQENRMYVQPKVVHYVSDGSGRDSYITKNDGGNTNFHHWRQHHDYQFGKSLRDWSNFRNRQPYSQGKMTQTFRMDESIIDMQKKQMDLTKKLSESKQMTKVQRQKRDFSPQLKDVRSNYQSYYFYDKR